MEPDGTTRADPILDARGREPERDDQEIARENLGGTVLGEIRRSAWYGRLCFRPSWLASALECAESGDGAALSGWMTAHKIPFDSANRKTLQEPDQDTIGG